MLKKVCTCGDVKMAKCARIISWFDGYFYYYDSISTLYSFI